MFQESRQCFLSLRGPSSEGIPSEYVLTGAPDENSIQLFSDVEGRSVMEGTVMERFIANPVDNQLYRSMARERNTVFNQPLATAKVRSISIVIIQKKSQFSGFLCLDGDYDGDGGGSPQVRDDGPSHAQQRSHGCKGRGTEVYRSDQREDGG